MATFNYTGNARIQWGNGKADTVQFIDYAADTGTLSVWQGQDEQPVYRGPIGDYPAAHIVFPVHEPVTV